jgi:penicillin-binding protein 1A
MNNFFQKFKENELIKYGITTSGNFLKSVLLFYEKLTLLISQLLSPLFEKLKPVTEPVHQFLQPFKLKYDQFVKLNPKSGFVINAGIKFVTSGFLILFFLIFLSSVGLLGDMPGKEELRNIENSNASEIYTADSVLIGKFYIENRTEITLDNISPYVITALLAVEDKRFFEHSGIDFTSWLRIFKGVATQSSGSGGGSTISQQLAKNLYPRKRYKLPGVSLLINKIRENIISIKLESIYSKEEIINLYLNTVPFGGDRFGINVASKYFYNKKASDLDPQEAATLVGMLKASTALDPTRNPENSLKRRNLVLERMLKNKEFTFNEKKMPTVSRLLKEGQLSDSLYSAALSKPLGASRFTSEHYEGLAPYLREYLRIVEMPRILKKNLREDGTEYSLYRDGLKIYTSIDSKMQKYGEESVVKHMTYLQSQFYQHWKGYPNEKPWGEDKWLDEQMFRSPRYELLRNQGLDSTEIDSIFKTVKVPMTVFTWNKGGSDTDTLMTPFDSIKHYFLMLNTGFMALDHKRSAVKAWVGGTNFKYFRFDHILSKRQVGSTFKPVIYAAAVKDSISPCKYFSNHQKTFGEWTPRNANNSYGDWYSMIGALTYSINVVAVRVIEAVGIQKAIDMAKVLGVTSELPREFGISLGAADVSLFDMMKVYGTFANHGIRPDIKIVYKITDRRGDVIYEDLSMVENTSDKNNIPRNEKNRVLSENEADIMGRMLRSVIDRGTGNRLRSQFVPEGEFSGKTGTTQNHSDGWFIAFNEELTTGCWVGGPSPAVRFRTMDLGQGGAMALPVVGNFWYKLSRDKKYSKLALAKFKINEYANNKTSCASRIGINPDDLQTMMQDTNYARYIKENGYQGLKELAKEFFGEEYGEKNTEDESEVESEEEGGEGGIF